MCGIVPSTIAQVPENLDSIVKSKIASYTKKDISIQGRIQAETDVNFNLSSGSPLFNYRISANLNSNIYGVSVPVNFSFSNGRTNYGYDLNPIQLPSFNRIGLSPTYGNWTGHIGFRQLSYTKYTLNNLQFKGIGVEYTPQNYYFSVMKGILKPAVIEDNTDISLIEPSFKRKVWAMKGAIDNKKYTIGFSFVKSIDDPLSLENYQSYRTSITPKENAVIGLFGRRTFKEKLILEIDYAFSGFSNDIVGDPFLDITTSYTAYNFFELFTTRVNSIYDKAYNTSITYEFEKFNLSYRQERVDPDFRTLGAFFFNNNFITRTGKLNSTLFEEKLNVSMEAGWENKAEPNIIQKDEGRFIAASNVKYQVNESLNLTAKYSNLNNSSLVRKPSLQSSTLDSILQTQTKEKIALGSTYIIGEKKNKVLNFGIGYQRGLQVDNNLNVTTRVNTSRTLNTSYTINSDESANNFAYSFSSVNDPSSSIKIHSLSHTCQKTLDKNKALSISNSLSRVKGQSLSNFNIETNINVNNV